MSFHGLGAGPGPTITYLVDLPLPWGKDTEVSLPMDALVSDAMDSMQSRLDVATAKAAIAVAASVAVVIGMAAWWLKK